ncbi:MAG: hypothetical protein WBN57_14140, partial [Gammaproteobacteria bacterium]
MQEPGGVNLLRRLVFLSKQITLYGVGDSDEKIAGAAVPQKKISRVFYRGGAWGVNLILGRVAAGPGCAMNSSLVW